MSFAGVVYYSAPAAGTAVTAGEPCGEVESTKSVSDIYSPVDGEAIEANPEIEDDPGLVNSDPYGAGWLLRIRLSDDGAQAEDLLTAEQNAELTKEEGGPCPAPAQLTGTGTTRRPPIR